MKKISVAQMGMRGFLGNKSHEKGMQMGKCTVSKEIQVLSFGWNVKNIGQDRDRQRIALK